MTDDEEHRRVKRRLGETKDEVKISRLITSEPKELDIQAWFCFDEPEREFPNPVSVRPLIFGKPGHMFHVCTTSGIGLELPGSGVLVKIDGRGELVRRIFTVRDRLRDDRGGREFQGPLGHGIYSWNRRVEGKVLSKTMVICYDYPVLTRLNLPEPSVRPEAGTSGSSRDAHRPETSEGALT